MCVGVSDKETCVWCGVWVCVYAMWAFLCAFCSVYNYFGNRKFVRIPVKVKWKKGSMDRITEYESKTNVTQLGLIDSNLIAFYDIFTAIFSINLIT